MQPSKVYVKIINENFSNRENASKKCVNRKDSSADQSAMAFENTENCSPSFEIEM